MNKSGALARVGMINAEFHGNVDIPHLLDLLNSAGFRWWRKEPTIQILKADNLEHVSFEYAFIRRDWSPEKKRYSD